MAAWRDIVAIAEREAGKKGGIDRLNSYIATYATNDEGLPLLIGDAGHDFGNYINIPISRETLISWAKRYIKNNTFKNDLTVYSTSKGEEHYLTFLEACRGNARLTLAEDDIFDLRDDASMHSMIEKLKAQDCYHFVIDATYGNPMKNATRDMHVHDLITGKTDAGSGLGPKSVGNAMYHDNAESFTIANYFGKNSLSFEKQGQYACMIMKGPDVPGGTRTITIPKGVSVNALCESLGLPGIRQGGKAGSALRIDQRPHPIDLLFKTGTDLGTLLQSIHLEYSTVKKPVGTLTNDRFFKERAGQFERNVILFTPDARSHRCEWWRAAPLKPLTDRDIEIIKAKFDLYNADTVRASLKRILDIKDEIMAEVATCKSFMNDYIVQEIYKIKEEYVKERDFWNKGKILQLTKENAEPYRKLVTSNVDLILRTKVEDSFVRFQEQILQIKTLLPNAFGRFKSIKADEPTKLSILHTIVKTIERVYVPGGAGAAGGEEDPQKLKWATSVLAHLSRNFASTYIVDYTGEKILTSSEAIRYIMSITDEQYDNYKNIFSKGVGILEEQEKKYACGYDKMINIISKIIDNGLTEVTALETRIAEAKAARIAVRAEEADAAEAAEPDAKRRKLDGGQQGGALYDTYPKCLLEHIPEGDGFYYAEFSNAREPKLPINKEILDQLIIHENNILLLLHSLIYYILDDCESNNMSVLVESDLMTLRLLIVSEEITDEELFEHIRFIVYDYDALSAIIVSRLTLDQLGKISRDITLEKISEMRAEAKAAFIKGTIDNYFPADCIPPSFYANDTTSDLTPGEAEPMEIVMKGAEPIERPKVPVAINRAPGGSEPVRMRGSGYTRKLRRKRKTRSKRNRIYRKRTRKHK